VRDDCEWELASNLTGGGQQLVVAGWHDDNEVRQPRLRSEERWPYLIADPRVVHSAARRAAEVSQIARLPERGVRGLFGGHRGTSAFRDDDLNSRLRSACRLRYDGVQLNFGGRQVRVLLLSAFDA